MLSNNLLCVLMFVRRVIVLQLFCWVLHKKSALQVRPPEASWISLIGRNIQSTYYHTQVWEREGREFYASIFHNNQYLKGWKSYIFPYLSIYSMYYLNKKLELKKG